ncbi:MAG: SPFH domain-containing protein [Planctomycetota bacterium]
MADPNTPISPISDRERPRDASVQLNQSGPDASSAVLMDPANQSLADALKITFRILQLGMFVLIVLFLLSGFQSIREGQSGIRLLFGKADSEVLEPGFRFSFPFPLGELVKVQTGAVRLVENRAFWTDSDGTTPSNRDRLPPARDGSVLTADGAVAHTQWSIQYRRSDPRLFAENVNRGQEDDIVRAAVQRGVVQSVATTTIDDLLKQGASSGEPLAVRARLIAQATLDAAESGIVIENLSLEQKSPPGRLIPAFDGVQAAASEATTAELRADTERQEILNQIAGPSAEALIGLIRQYEAALETGDTARGEEVLAVIHTVLEGREASLDGETIAASVSGEVARIIASARRERSQAVARARAELALFEAQLQKYNANPTLAVKQSAYDALAAYLGGPTVQLMFVPEDAEELVLRLNADPDLRKELIRQRQLIQAIEAENRREDMRRGNEFTIERGTPTPGM